MRAVNTTTKNIRRAPFQTLSAVGVLTLTFFVSSVFVLVALASQQILRHFETRPQVIAYLKDDASSTQIDDLKKKLQDTKVVESVKYVSKDEALAIYKESVGNDPLLLGSVTNLSLITAEVLPASIEISAVTANDFPKIVDTLKTSDIVDVTAKGEKDIDFPQSVVSELTAWTNGIRVVGLILIGALMLSSVMTIVIILSMKISSRKVEISTMKLLGAGGSFIAWPYIFESMFYTVGGTVLGWLLTYIGLLYATPFLVPRLAGIIELPVSPIVMFSVLGGLLVLSIVLGFVSGILAIGRFLRRK